MWWKFWTWFRHDESHENPTIAPGRRHAAGATVSGAGLEGSDDLLLSISGLIDEQIVTERAERKISGDSVTGPSNESAENIPGENAGLETWAGAIPTVAPTPIQISPAELVREESQLPTATMQIPENPGRLNTVPSHTAKPGELPLDSAPRRESQSNRNTDAGNRSDSMRTLVAQDGNWPSFEELSSSFNELDEADDDSEGPSPFQTIVPRDD